MGCGYFACQSNGLSCQTRPFLVRLSYEIHLTTKAGLPDFPMGNSFFWATCCACSDRCRHSNEKYMWSSRQDILKSYLTVFFVAFRKKASKMFFAHTPLRFPWVYFCCYPIWKTCLPLCLIILQVSENALSCQSRWFFAALSFNVH